MLARRTRSAPSPLVGEGWGGGWCVWQRGCINLATPTPDPSPQGGGENSAAPRRNRTNDSSLLNPLLFHLQRQPHGLAGGGRALDGDRRFQIDARLLGRGMDRGRAGREMIEPGARLVAERT